MEAVGICAKQSMARAAEEVKADQLSKDLILVHTVQLQPMIKAQISGRMASIGISDVVTASVYSEKTHLKLMMIMIGFWRVPEIDFRYETKA